MTTISCTQRRVWLAAISQWRRPSRLFHCVFLPPPPPLRLILLTLLKRPLSAGQKVTDSSERFRLNRTAKRKLDDQWLMGRIEGVALLLLVGRTG